MTRMRRSSSTPTSASSATCTRSCRSWPSWCERARRLEHATRSRIAQSAGSVGRMTPLRPADFPPSFRADEFVVAPGEAEIEVGVLIVGAGPAGLACAIRLGQLLQGAPELGERLGEVPVAVLEKGKQPGSHLLSGAVVNPAPLRRLFEGRLPTREMPFYGRVAHESVYFLTPRRALRIPTPPTMRNSGNYVASLSQLGRWLAERADEAGATILPETSGHALLVGDGRVRGVRTGDRGRGRGGEELGNFEPGSDVHARVTVLAEGTQGHLTGVALDRFALEGENPQVWALGVKEVWKVAKPLDRVIHTMGWPLRAAAKYREWGGSPRRRPSRRCSRARAPGGAARWRATTSRFATASSGATCARCGTCGRRSAAASGWAVP